MPPPEASNPIAIGPEKSNLAEAQDNDFKIAIMNMFKTLEGILVNALIDT